MADLNRPTETNSFLEPPRKIPDTLNVLTILTFIGSGLGIIGAFWSYIGAKANYDRTASTNPDQIPEFAKRLVGGDPLEIARKSLDNRLPILLLTLIGCFLCVYGAIQMRSLKKTGFSLYVIGEVLPFISTVIFVSAGVLGGVGGIIGIIISLVFIILYATQLKYLR